MERKNKRKTGRAKSLIVVRFKVLFDVFCTSKKVFAQKLVDQRCLDYLDGVKDILWLIKCAWDIYSLIINCRNNYGFKSGSRAVYA